MLAYRTVPARHKDAHGSLARSSLTWAPRAAWFCRWGSPWSIGFALPLLMLVGILPAVGALGSPTSAFTGQMAFAQNFSSQLDINGNGVQDILDDWLDGRVTYDELRLEAVSATPLSAKARVQPAAVGDGFPQGIKPAEGGWQAGRLRLSAHR